MLRKYDCHKVKKLTHLAKQNIHLFFKYDVKLGLSSQICKFLFISHHLEP